MINPKNSSRKRNNKPISRKNKMLHTSFMLNTNKSCNKTKTDHRRSILRIKERKCTASSDFNLIFC